MDFKNFQLKSEDDGSYTISHPNGKSMKIGKKGLSEKAHEVIGKLKKYADGGGVAANAIDQLVDNAPAQQFAPSNDVAPASIPDAAPVVAPSSAGEIPVGNVAAPEMPQAPLAPAVQQDPLVQQKLGTQDLLNKQEQDIKKFTGESGAAESQKVKALSDYNQMEQGRQTPEEIVAGYKGKDDALAKAYMDNKIDPNRYLANQSTGSKIAASIGLLFSGLGSGASGQQNLALNQINQSIANDIDAQKNEQGKQQNLFNMNQKALGNDMAAHAATENQLWTGVQAKIAQASAGVENAQTKLKAAEMINQIEQQKVSNRLRLGLLTQGQGAGGNGLSQADPTQVANELITDPAQKNKAIDEIGKAQHIAKNQAQMLDLWDKATKEQTVLRTGAGLLRDSPSITALRAFGQPLIKDEAGRPSEIQQKIYNDLLPRAGDSENALTGAHLTEKRANFVKYLQNIADAPTAKANGINLNNFASTNTNTFQAQPKNDQYMAWAQANPSNPLAKKYLKANGG